MNSKSEDRLNNLSLHATNEAYGVSAGPVYDVVNPRGTAPTDNLELEKNMSYGQCISQGK